ncbi:MerR family transcriptional regulator [Thauera sp. CAU 1555]|uniref:MerR family transcriptional regulator n=1 Tax=Thauera sedimentorum TaxID=2767595 RepID=A0ABR9BEU0_9RHOO|nr:MerR family transcriptional regulator [Thauera sedimentorum]MBC9073614.1 MerR family transcriptional regulator [Thauera sedimentorum]MBD8504533.1 MerR family transcriptional regulator [Thauera sedimentorum]
MPNSALDTNSAAQALGIAAVERDTGIAKDTLRVWERRYGFPAPLRDAHGERLYPSAQVEKLRLMRRLMDQGRRPSTIVRLSTDELATLLDAAGPGEVDPQRSEREAALLQLVRLHRSNELRAALYQLLLKQGLQRFVADTVAPLNDCIGHAWLRGEIDVPEEHLYTEQVQNVLRSAIGSQAVAGGRPRILLTTFPDEQHALGLLMAEATLVPEGAACVSLGTQTPMSDIRSAAEAGTFDVVALSFSAAYPQRQAVDGLNALRELLPPGIALWAGGAAVQGKNRRLNGVRVITDLDDALTALAQWRAEHHN